MRVSVVGTGYVGLVAAVGLAETGNSVLAVDSDPALVAELQDGVCGLHEPGVEPMLVRNLKEGRLRFSTSLAEAAGFGEVIMVAVGTPPLPDGNADMTQVEHVIVSLASHISQYRIIVMKSTVPVGTCDWVRGLVARHCEVEVDVVSNPEFLKEGSALADFMKPERVVVGTSSARARQVLSDLYAPYIRTLNPIIFMDEKSSEMTKYACNAMLATRISFMNEMANLCDAVGADIQHVRHGMGTDPRIGSLFLFPGVGFGGSCFPKDLSALRAKARGLGLDVPLLDAVVRVNETQKLLMVQRVRQHFGSNLSGRRFAVWGLAFKPNTDDMREAPSLAIIRELIAAGAGVTAYDPVALERCRTILGNAIDYADSAYAALEQADALIVLTEWNEFRSPDFQRIRTLLRLPVVFDGRNLFEPDVLRKQGFFVYTVGRGNGGAACSLTEET